MGYTPSPVAQNRSLSSGGVVARGGGITDITATMKEDPDDFPLLNLREVQLSEPFASVHIVLSERSRTA